VTWKRRSGSKRRRWCGSYQPRGMEAINHCVRSRPTRTVRWQPTRDCSVVVAGKREGRRQPNGASLGGGWWVVGVCGGGWCS
jgi:hypothetical protein